MDNNNKMEERKMKKKIGIVLVIALTVGLLSFGISAQDLGRITRIYGTEERAIDCRGFDEFYKGEMFVWFMIDTDIKAEEGFSEINRQVLGDSVIRPSVNDKIRIGGISVRQHNIASGNPYTAMIAYQENGEGKLRMAVWLSWNGVSIQDLFNKDMYDEFVFEILPGLMAPDEGYSLTNQIHREIEPAKFTISIEDLEFEQDTDNPNYNPGIHEGAYKPMFEDLEAQWVRHDTQSDTTEEETQVTPTPTPTPAPTTTPESDAPVTTPDESEETPVSDTQPSDEVSEETSTPKESESDTTEPESTESEISEETTDEQEDSGTILPLIIAIAGILIIGGGVGYFIYMKKKA